MKAITGVRVWTAENAAALCIWKCTSQRCTSYYHFWTYVHQTNNQTGQREFVVVHGGEQHGTIQRPLRVGVGRNVHTECRPSRSKQSLSPGPSRTGSNHALKCQEISTRTNRFKSAPHPHPARLPSPSPGTLPASAAEAPTMASLKRELSSRCHPLTMCSILL